MKNLEKSSSANIFKRAASAVIISAMLAPSAAQIALAQDVEQPKVDPKVDTASETVENKTAVTKHRDEAQANYDKDLATSEAAKKDLDTKQAAFDTSVKNLETAKVQETQASESAETAFKDAKSKAVENLKASVDTLAKAKETKTQKESELAQKTTELEEAKTQANEAQKEFDKVSEEFKQQGKSLDQLDEAQAQLDEAKKLAEQKAGELTGATEAQEQADAELKAATEAQKQAETDVQAAEAKVAEVTEQKNQADEALARADAAYKESLKDDNAQQLADAQEAKQTAQDNLTKANETVETLTGELDAAKADLKKAQDAQQQADTLKKAAEAKVVELEGEITSAQNTIQENTAKVEALAPQVEEAQSRYDGLKREHDATKAALTEKQDEVARLQAEKDKAQKALDDAKKQAESATDSSQILVEGAYHFFKSLADKGNQDAQQALNILENCDLHNFIKRGNPLSATAYENILIALDQIDHGNEIRKNDEGHLKALKVSHTAMAMAMANADWSTANFGHSEQHFGGYYNGENAAWGSQDPYVGWYTKEKKIYNDAVAAGEFDPNVEGSFEAWGKKFTTERKNYTNNRGAVGHYMTLVEKKGIHFDVTGFGYSQLPLKLDGFTNVPAMTSVQEFVSDYIVQGHGNADKTVDGQAPKPQEAYTTDEYRNLLNTWKDGLSTADIDGLEDKQRDLEAAKEALNTAKGQLANLEGTEATQKTATEEAKTTLDGLVAQKEEAANNITTANAKVTEAQGQKTLAEAEASKQQQEFTKAEGQIETATGKVQAAQDKLTPAIEDQTAKKTLFDQKAQALQIFEEQNQALVAKQNQLKATLDAADLDVKAKEATLQKANDDLTAAQGDLTQKQDDVATKTTALANADTALTAAQTADTQAKTEVTAKQNAFDALETDLSALKQAKVALDTAVEHQTDAQKALNDATASLREATDALTTATAENTKAQARHDQLAGVTFNGVDTPATGDAVLDQKITDLKSAKAHAATAAKAHTDAKAAVDAAKVAYTDALADLARSKVELDSYTLKVLEGSHQKIAQGTELVFRINRDPEGFKELLVDGVVVDAKNYTVVKGSTIITIAPEFSATLKAGEHSLKAVYDNGAFAETVFNIIAKKPAPKHLDTSKVKKVAVQKKVENKVPTTADLSFVGSVASALAGITALGAAGFGRRKNQ